MGYEHYSDAYAYMAYGLFLLFCLAVVLGVLKTLAEEIGDRLYKFWRTPVGTCVWVSALLAFAIYTIRFYATKGGH